MRESPLLWFARAYARALLLGVVAQISANDQDWKSDIINFSNCPAPPPVWPTVPAKPGIAHTFRLECMHHCNIGRTDTIIVYSEYNLSALS